MGIGRICLFAVVIGVVLALACSPFIFTIPARTPTAMWVSAPLCLMSEAHVYGRANGTGDKGTYFRAHLKSKKMNNQIAGSSECEIRNVGFKVKNGSSSYLPFRGGNYGNSTYAGVFALYLGNSRATYGSNVGFRAALPQAGDVLFKDTAQSIEDKGNCFLTL
mgnify:CR=1 FL=1